MVRLGEIKIRIQNLELGIMVKVENQESQSFRKEAFAKSEKWGGVIAGIIGLVIENTSLVLGGIIFIADGARRSRKQNIQSTISKPA